MLIKKKKKKIVGPLSQTEMEEEWIGGGNRVYGYGEKGLGGKEEGGNCS